MNRRSRTWTVVSLMLLLSMVLSTAPAFAQEGVYLPFTHGRPVPETPTPRAVPTDINSYVVFMEADGVAAMARESGVEAGSADAAAYEASLEASHASALAAVGADASSLLHNYTYAFNGFAAVLTPAQAKAMQSQAGVTLVVRDQLRFATTDSSPVSLGLTDEGEEYMSGLSAHGYTGEGVVVGVIDTGIWPEHLSFADDGSYGASPVGPVPCEFGNVVHNPNDAPFTCNNKLLGARQVLATYRLLIGADPDEFDSARDDSGHGTHTASTAAGNALVSASIYGIPRGRISGIAPRARVIAYKGLGNLGGFTSDLAAAIDQAVEDGVDVINYSIGGGAGAPGADEIAFLFAEAAGVYVATSAGNSGSGPATLGNPGTMPWMTTVGANTQKRFFQGTAVLGDGSQYPGASITFGTDVLPLVDAEFAGGDLCGPGTLDPAVVSGSIVLCRRGVFGRAEKSLAVYLAGGAGMILYENTDDNNLFTDTHWVPSVHVDNTPGLAIKAYIASAANPTARIDARQSSVWPSAPSMTFFSSRGPNPVSPDLIKPDITAPGIQIMAGFSPFPDPGDYPGQLFAAIAGTSMSSPHVAGLFALIKEAHPEWNAATAKSALMTTTHQKVVDNDRVSPADPFDMGAGHAFVPGTAKPGTAFQPGLVYDAGLFEYAAYTCGAGFGVFTPGSCEFLESIGVPSEAYNLNVPSIGVANIPGSRTVMRTVTSVAQDPGVHQYNAVVDAPDGYEVTVDPSRLSLASGETATFYVTFTNVSAPIGEWRFGSLTWRDRFGPKVYSPIAVKASSFEAPSAVAGSGESGSASFDVSFGYTGDYSAAAHGLRPATVTSDNVLQDPDQNFDPDDGFSNRHDFSLTGAALFRIAMPPEATEADADLDIYVFDPNGDLVASSTAGGTEELVDIASPADGTWSVYVHGWSAPGGDSDYDMYTWIISATPGGNLSIDSAPASATIGATETIDLSWSGATAGQWHLGAVSHSDSAGVMGLTLVEVDNR